ncbi:MAG: PAS domain S-box protein [Actinomycetota bacterium]|nr:PAS domain S-box protein [Actinomycetota bacterium]
MRGKVRRQRGGGADEEGVRLHPWRWFAAYLAVAAAVAAAGTLFALYLRADVRRSAQDELSAVADLKVGQIRNWLDERLGDAMAAVGSPFFAREAARFLAAPDDPERAAELLSWMRSRMESNGYSALFLLDAEGRGALDLNPRGEPLGEYARDLALSCMAGGEVGVSDLHRGEGYGEIHMDLAAPLPAGAGGVSAGALLMRIDPRDFLYPFIQSWPTPSDTAETLLVRREEDEVLFLNELRHREETALELRLPLADEDLPAARAARGEEGVAEGTDYRGVRVLSASRSVPCTEWYLVAKEDTSEIYSPLTLRVGLVVALTSLLVLVLGAAMGLAWTRRRVRLLRRQYELEAELRASEEMYRLLFLRTPIGVFHYGRDLVITDCNDRFVEILRSSRERLVGLDMNTLRDRRVLPAIRAALSGAEGLYEGPYSATTSEARIHVSLRTTPLRDSEGTIIGGVGIVEDITERRILQEKLEERELFLRRLTDNMLDLISQIDVNGNFVYLSPSNERVLGYRRDELLGHNVMELVHPDDLPAVAEAYARSNRELVPGQVEFRAKKADGAFVWVESVGNPLFNEAGELIGAIFVTRDVTERKRAEERLERLNRCFLELGADPLENIARIVDAGREILEADAMHYTRMVGGRFFIYRTGEGGGGFEPLDEERHRLCREMIAEGRDQPVLVEDLGASGYAESLPGEEGGGAVSWFAFPVRVHGGTVGALGMLIGGGRGIGGEARDFAGLLARAIAVEEERLAHEEELRDFVDIASHELRHPMTVIKGYASTLLSYFDRMDERARREVLEDIERGVDRLEKLVYQLLDTARIERRKLALNLKESDLVPVVEEVVREMRQRIPSVPISLRVAEPPGAVRVDAERISQVLVILIENAVNYSPPGASVEVEVSGDGEGAAAVAVLDRGWGVPEEARERIFERFYQVGDAAHHSSEGIGLGLYIAREIVKAHGGRIWHEPREGGGSVFRFTLP